MGRGGAGGRGGDAREWRTLNEDNESKNYVSYIFHLCYTAKQKSSERYVDFLKKSSSRSEQMPYVHHDKYMQEASPSMNISVII